ncbi:hypothetical protein KRP22_001879 [Phytophthora ramorum]|nr:hypothetical protein KRP22_1162 [Phytophthora ramorum]
MSMTLKPDPPLKVVSAELAPIRTRPRADSDTSEPDGTTLLEQDLQNDQDGINPIVEDCLYNLIVDIQHHYEDLGLGQVRAVDDEFAANKPNAVPLPVNPPPVEACWEHFAPPADFTMEKACAYDAMYRMLLTVERSYERLGVAAERAADSPPSAPLEDPGFIVGNYKVPAPEPLTRPNPSPFLTSLRQPQPSRRRRPPPPPPPLSALGMRLRFLSVKPEEPAAKQARTTQEAPGTTGMARRLNTATAKQFPFISIDARRTKPLRGVCYHVRFLDGTDDWLPRQLLVEDLQERHCNWVDWWYDEDNQETKPYICFMKGLPEYRDGMTASEGGDCVVQAINALYKLAGHPLFTSPADWEDFCSQTGVTPDEGINMVKTKGLLRWM